MKKIWLLLFLILATLSVCFVLYRKPRPHLSVIGCAKMADGLGRQSIELIQALHNEMSIGYIAIKKPCLEDIPEAVLPFIEHQNGRLGHVVIYENSLPDPNKKAKGKLNKTLKGKKRPDQIRIAYSMIESSKIPPIWAQLLNEYFDAVAVPDEFLVSVYKDSGVTIPLFVVPLGLNLEPFLNQPLKKDRNKPFRFINPASLIARKNHEGLIKAFHKAFGDNPDVELHMNYRYSDEKSLETVLPLLHSLNSKNIFLTNQKLNAQEYLNYFLKGDVLVNLAKGEGFSIQPREAMALGLPVIISDNTAHKTILKTGLALGVKCPMTEKCYNTMMKCMSGEDYIPDLELAAEQMLEVYNNYETYILKAEERRQWASTYQYENLKNYYITLIKPSKIELCNKNEVINDVLYTSDIVLYRKYLKLIKHLERSKQN